MNYRMEFNFCAFILYTLTIITNLTYRKTRELHNRVFTCLVWVSYAGVIANILNAYGNMGYISLSKSILITFDYIYFISLISITFIYALYAVSLTKNRLISKSLLANIFVFMPFISMIIILAGNSFTGLIFKYVDGVYQRGSGQIYMYIVSIFYGTFGCIYVLNEKKSTTKTLKAIMVAFVTVCCIFALLQYLFPQLLMQHLGISICELFLLLNIQKPQDNINSEYDIFNKSSFERLFKLKRNSEDNMQVLLVYIEDMDFVAHSFGADMQSNIMKGVSDFLKSIAGRYVYYIDNFTFIIYTKDSNQTEEFIKKMYDRFQEKWGDDDNGMDANYKALPIRIPQDVKDIDSIYFARDTLQGIGCVDKNVANIEEINFEKFERRIKIEKIIKRAIAEDNFMIYYQPIYSFKDDRIVSAEALLRLKDPDEGFIGPNEFIPIAEQNGYILQIGEIVFHKVFNFFAKNDLKKSGIKYVEVNLSTIQCMQVDLAQQVMSLMKQYGVEADMLNLEITETAAVQSPKILLNNLKMMNEDGLTFSLDDFGTGYSNISSLMSLPLRIIKFDKSMIDMATTTDVGKNVIESSVAMVKKMGMEIVAEGIEQKEQIDMLKKMGVDFLQGYYFSKPLPEKDFIEFIGTY